MTPDSGRGPNPDPGVDARVGVGVDLAYHGDQDASAGLLDLAVNVRVEPPPAWLTEAIVAACHNLGRYPDPTEATAALAAYHGRRPEEVLVTAGAAEAFGLIARAIPPGGAIVVHPQFTEPERALRVAGHQVTRHQLVPETGFRLNPALVPEAGRVVVIGNPTNPTGVLHPAADVTALARPDRVLVVDEAFMDAVPGEPASLAGRTDVPGLVVVRSLTKTWGLPGLRIGYLLAPARLVQAFRDRQPPWAVSTPALAAALACATDRARREAHDRALRLEQWREVLRTRLLARGLECVAGSRAPFLLVRAPAGLGVTRELRSRNIAVRRADTFPGLGSEWFRVAVRDEPSRDTLLAVLDEILAAG